MVIILVVDNPKEWALKIPNVEIVSSHDYFSDKRYITLKNAKLFNLCKSYRYQSNGYYVSLLAEARGHKPVPNITTIQDLKSQTIIRFVSEEMDKLIQKELSQLKSKTFTLSIYFGKNVARKYDKLSTQLFKFFHAPFIRAYFVNNGNKWYIQNINPISTDEIPSEHNDFVIESAKEYFLKKRGNFKIKASPRYDMAILYDPRLKNENPSNDRAIRHFIKAAEHHGINAEIIEKEDYGRIAEYDMLFIRETTKVNHHTFRFSQRAQAEGLIVVDDPESILKCSNKVYLAELLSRHKIDIPKTVMIHRKNKDFDEIISHLKFPIILKQPDSSFSHGVVKVNDMAEFINMVNKLLDKSDLIIAQEFIPTDFDWRIGIFNREFLFACKYHMAKKHWQIINNTIEGDNKYGKAEGVPLQSVPKIVLKTAMKAANLIGNGLYGVDIKEIGKKAFVIEINDNPNIDAGYEDKIYKDELYNKIMRIFLTKLEEKKSKVYL